jgi:predicted transcriptional regulator
MIGQIKMQNQSKSIQQFLLNNIPKHPNDIVSVSMHKFNVSRTTVLRHINHLIKQNKITKTGNTKQIRYSLLSELNKEYIIDLTDEFDEFDFFTDHLSNLLKANVSSDCYEICEYVVTEMLNNVKDHSKGKKGTVKLWFEKDSIYCNIIDNGVGAFKTLKLSTSLTDIRDIIFELSKGKLTRDPDNHTGEGIFFSSRAVDEFSIIGNEYKFYRNNLVRDWTLEKVGDTDGTKIEFNIKKDCDRALKPLFEAYTDDFTFTKTDIFVDLSKRFGERLISRSQAKRVCKRLTEFTHVTLDFKKVQVVGQGFVDQVFRVFQREHPGISISYINANENIEYMIKRGLN